MARPSKYTTKLGDIICTRIANGESVLKICEDDDMPSEATVYYWALHNDEFSEKYAQAREVQAENWFDRTLEVAKEADEVITGSDKSDNARVAAKKLQVDTYKWHMSKLKPKKYGDKVDVTTGGKDFGNALADFLTSNTRASDGEDTE